MYTITPPIDPVKFENICMDYLMSKYDADATLYGRRGQKQHGFNCPNINAIIVVKYKQHKAAD